MRDDRRARERTSNTTVEEPPDDGDSSSSNESENDPETEIDECSTTSSSGGTNCGAPEVSYSSHICCDFVAVDQLVGEQRAFFRSGATRCLEKRRAALTTVKEMIEQHKDEIAAAIHKDLGR
ncbi:unnamed protein product, partial [Heligmosomoides polygyrus]|uniref:Uncharacterized protein n=1 Tax=Heligmosomoides polygyrus TaxID=6339 RepID=A0A183F7M3_HELPZ